MNRTIPTSPLDALARLGEPVDADDDWRIADDPASPAPVAAPASPVRAMPEAAGEAEAGARDAAAVRSLRPQPRTSTTPMSAPRRGLAVLCLVLGVLAVAGFAGTGYFGRAWLSQRSTNSQTTQVRSTAEGFVSALTNFDPGTVDADFARIQGYATGSFATQAKQFFSSTIRSQLQTAGAASRGQIQDLFVESLSGNQASVFAVVDQTYVNDKMTSPAADTLRLDLVMTLSASGWKISTVTVVQSPAGFPTAGSGSTGSSGSKG